MKNETPTQAARRICPAWLQPERYAHYLDVLSALEAQRKNALLDAEIIVDEIRMKEERLANPDVKDTICWVGRRIIEAIRIASNQKK